MKKYIAAFDQGTTSSRCVLFDQDGSICGVKQQEYTQYFPQNGWVEHDPNEIWASQFGVFMELMASENISGEQIDSIGITNQRETVIVWEKDTAKPIYPAIVWQCRRTADRVLQLKKDGYEEIIREKTGLILDPYFSATKVEWILDHVEGSRERAKNGELLFGTVDTWLMYKMTKGKVFATDYTNASRTMLYNIHSLCWDQELLELFGIPLEMMPDVKDSSGIFGVTNKELFGYEIPIAGVAGDQQAALFGQGCFTSGEVKNTYGTGCFLLMNTGENAVVSKHGLLTTIAAGMDGKVTYALEGSVFVAGALIQWLRDEMGLIPHAKETETLANEVPDSNGVYIVPAFTGLGAPYWDSYARGAIFGLTRGTKKAHIVRAALEALAYQTMDVLHAMEEDSGNSIRSLKVDGGASANNFLLQFQADVLNAEVVRPEVIETTAYGVCCLAGLATGFFKDQKELKRQWKSERVFLPEWSDEERRDKIKGWQEAVGRTRTHRTD